MFSFPIHQFTILCFIIFFFVFFLLLLKCLSLSKYTASLLLTYLGSYRGRIIRRKRQKNTGARKRGNDLFQGQFLLQVLSTAFQLGLNYFFFWGGEWGGGGKGTQFSLF